MPTLSLTMIVRDEARWIEECLGAIAEHVDEIVIADTGSTDGTPDLARRFGSTIIDFPWIDDFAAARNASLDAATSDWCLVLDADEILDPRDAKRLRTLMESGPDAHHLIQRTYTNDSTLHNWTPLKGECAFAGGLTGYYDVPLVRLFRRRPELRFTGRIHEMIEPSAAAHSIPWQTSDVVMHHRQFLNPPTRIEDKARKYLALSEKKTQENPEDARAFRELGQAAMQLGEWEVAADALRRAVALNPEVHDNQINLVAALCRGRQHAEALVVLGDALRRFPNDPTLLEAKGEAHQALGQWDDAIRAHTQCLEAAPDHFRACNNLGVVHLNRGQPDAAMKHLMKAQRLNPQSTLPLINLGIAHRLKGNLKQAVALFEKVIAREPQNWRVLLERGDIDFQTHCFPQAMQWYQRAEAVEGAGPEVDAKICSCLLTEQRWDEALERAERAAKANPRLLPLLEQVRAHAAKQGGAQ